ncbi:energy transducer TonB [Kordiimonas marina]|uniref:energy transducer TonB n=1 Tax=Kordiimonas marina TaxID=2872312 RepID=UPI001FF60E85|nr:TonB family protein [Kordiimonas marina]MCJ9430547.1 energy transducer TonB [Kordiimonas marina]
MRKFLLPLLFAPLAVGVVSLSVAHADAMSDWTKAVSKLVAAKQGYPRAAIARQLEGRAKVRLTVAADGTISNYEIIEPTGKGPLDHAIPKLIGRINPLPKLPGGKAEMTFILPLAWSLD